MSVEIEKVIAHHIANSRYDRIPDDAVATGKRSIVDGIAALMAGTAAPGISSLMQLSAGWEGAAESRVFGSTLRLPAPQAAWINGGQIRALELDDCTDTIAIHPGAALLPVLLAVADKYPLSGKQFLHALTVGQDLYVRFGLAIRPSVMATGRNEIYRIFAAVAAVSVALELNEDVVLNALGLSSSFCSVDLQCILEGTMAIWVQYGNSATGALQSCLLAASGVTGPKAFLTGKAGYLTVVESDSDPTRITQGLGERYESVQIAVKPYAACRGTHMIIDMAHEHNANSFTSTDEIERVEIRLSPEMYDLVAEPRAAKTRPTTSPEAQFSIYYTAAAALQGQNMGLADTLPDRLAAHRTLALIDRITVASDEKFRTNRIVGRTDMTVWLRTGESHHLASSVPLGNPDKPVSAAMLRAKLVDCLKYAQHDTEASHIDRFLSDVEQLEDVPDVARIFDVFF